MAALPHRHHGGDRLRQADQALPAGSGYIMTRDPHSGLTSPKRPPDRGADAVASRLPGALEQGSNGEIQAMPIACRRGWYGETLPTAARDTRIAHSQGAST